MKKLTLEFIKGEFEKEGLTVTLVELCKDRVFVNYTCSNDHSHRVRWDSWNRKCKSCFSHGKVTLEFIRDYFNSKGHILLTNKYDHSRGVLKYLDSKGDECVTTWNRYKNNKQLCANEDLSFDKIKYFFVLEGYTLLSTEYKNASTKLDYICPQGHQHSVTWKGWVFGNRCPYCSKKIRKTIEEMKVFFESEGYILLSRSYSNAYTKLDYICPQGHQHSVTWGNWSSGVRCPTCAGQTSVSIEHVKSSFEKEGYELLSTVYITSKHKLKYKCPKGHVHSISWMKWSQGRRCRDCSYDIRAVNQSGPNSAWWLGGLSMMEYCAVWGDKEYKNSIKERDGCRCLNPYCCSKDPNKLVLHHVNYDKKDCHFKNIITLCNGCNLKANTDREWHQDWYQALLHNRYGYNY